MFKNLWLKIKGFFQLTFGGRAKFEQFLVDHADDAIDFVETIKGFVNSPLMITLMTIFPKLAAKAKPVLDKAEKFLDEILKRLQLATPCLAEPDVVKRIKCLVDVIKGKTDAEKADLYQQIATTYIQIKSREYTKDGQEISLSQARNIVGMKYLEKKAEAAGVAVPANGDDDEFDDDDD